jgi:hypothetical protein
MLIRSTDYPVRATAATQAGRPEFPGKSGLAGPLHQIIALAHGGQTEVRANTGAQVASVQMCDSMLRLLLAAFAVLPRALTGLEGADYFAVLSSHRP